MSLRDTYNKLSPWIILALGILTLVIISYYNVKSERNEQKIEQIEYTDSLGKYHKYYYDTKFKELKKTNKQLYDSLKQYKDKIDYIVQFEHEKDYNSGVVYVHDTIANDTVMVSKTYEYTSEPNDTFIYKLKINSEKEPNWYSLQAKTKNKFTIVNKKEGGMNHMTIESSNDGRIINETVYRDKPKRSLGKRFAIGPAVTSGYDIINHRWGIMLGASITFDIK